MLFVHICSTWSIVELKARSETWISRNDESGKSLVHFSYLMSLMVYLRSQRTPNVQMKYSMFDRSIYRLLVLNRGCKRDSLQIMIFVYVCSTWGIIELKTRFETWITKNVENGAGNLPYLKTLMAYLSSQWTPNVQIKYFMFDCLN
jgi:hypothetical protein